MRNISVAIATYNEEKNLKRCLESIAFWVDEIVIVDGSSTDKTVDIAKDFGAKVVITDNPLNFHINKQKAIDACSREWIFQLDADEVVTVELKKEILSVVKQKNINGYWIPRKNNFLGKFLVKGGQYPDYTLRLYRRGKGRLPCDSVHEQAIVAGRVGYLQNPLLHYPYANFTEYLDHFNRYTDISAQEHKDSELKISLVSFTNYMLTKPIHWFLISFIRHKGFMDGFSGFVFSFFSSLRFPVSYIKYWQNR
ncbi:glycosyltransferase family 2 protein [Candidatus Gottesmanbacteria bacterium]|nr:glycosyltransferase family 2 protein [Candidatus Gottesmanbacteria bacterium]